MKIHTISLCITAIIFLLLILSVIKTRHIEDLNISICIYQVNSNFSNVELSENITSPFKEIIEQYKFGKALDFKHSNFLVFNDYTNMDQKLSTLPFIRNKNYYINGLAGLDQLCSKSQLAYWIKKRGYGYILPKTYCLDNKEDMMEFDKNHEKKHHILKKNIQRQSGLIITDNYQWISADANRQDYVVAQELLKNPYIISGRKINIRVYMVVIRKNNNLSFYIYNDGFIYYTAQPYDPDNFSLETNITTGYIDRAVYEKNPLTTQDFMMYLGPDDARKLLENMYILFAKIKNTFSSILSSNNKNIPGTLFNIFGVDIAPDSDLELSLIEFNKGPSLAYMDDRDKDVKYNLIRDLLGLIELVHDSESDNFIKIND